MNPIRCGCGNWLGVLHDDGRIEIRHRGRSLIGHLDEITCEKDGRIWRPEAPRPSLDAPGGRYPPETPFFSHAWEPAGPRASLLRA